MNQASDPAARAAPAEAATAEGRREALQRLTTGIAAAPLALLAAHSAAQTSAPPATPGRPPGLAPSLRDPRTLYPRPPFPAQEQPWPGLAARMQPRPDHGEKSYVGSGRLTGRKALLTGGDSGLGRAAAIAFAREGADVAINYLPQEEEDAREVVELIRSMGRRVIALPGDLRTEAFCLRLVDDALKGLGGLDILCNNAARQTAQKSILDISSEQFDSTMKTNLYAMFWITKAALPHLPPGSVIINTASIVATAPPPMLLDYATTKAGIVAFTKSLAHQVAERGIRVNAIAPGPFWTPLQPSGGQLPGELPRFGSDTPLGRPGQPAEIAPLFVMAASSEASYTSGDVIAATGGRPGP